MSSDVHQVGGRDPHDVLDVPPDADRQQVIRAFRRKVRRGGHPDTGGDAQAFEEIVQARDALLAQAQPAAHDHERHETRATPRTASAPKTDPSSDLSPPRETNKLAVVTVVLAALGPLLWPVAIAIGHLALRQIKRTGQGGGTVVPVVLLFLYVFTIPVLARVLSMMLIP